MFETKIWNRRKTPQPVYNTDGVMIRMLQPDEVVTIESSNDRTILAPYSEIVFERDGAVSLTKRSAWVDPYFKSPWRIEIVNLEGKELEQRVVGGETVHLQRGIPITRFVESSDPLAEFEQIEIRLTKQRVKLEKIPGYWGYEAVQKDVKTPRPAKDLEQIKKDREQVEKPAPADTPKEQ